MRVSKTALARANKRADTAKKSLYRIRTKMKGNPNIATVGSVALGGALPVYLPALGLPAEFMSVPTCTWHTCALGNLKKSLSKA